MIPIYKRFAPNFFNFGIIFAFSLFETFVASKVFHRVFTFTFHCDMQRQAPVGAIRRLDDQVEYDTVVHYVRLWDRGHDGSLWVHPSEVINIPPVYGNINTTIQTPDGEVFLFTLSLSGRFLEVYTFCLNSGFCPIFCVSPECV